MNAAGLFGRSAAATSFDGKPAMSETAMTLEIGMWYPAYPAAVGNADDG